MAGDIFDDLGVSQPQQQTTTDTGGINPDVIRTGMGEGDPEYFASVLVNRQQKSGRSYDQLITDPTQFEARTGKDWNKYAQISTDSPEYKSYYNKAAPILMGEKKPVVDYDSYYSPAGQKQNNRPNPSWDDGTGTVGPDKNLYFKDKYAPPSGSGPRDVFDDLGVTNKATPAGDVSKPTAGESAGGGANYDDPAQLQLDANRADPDGQWPIHDPYNNVGRNADGSIAYVGDPRGSMTVDKNGNKTVNISASFDPEVINHYLQTHPHDIANKGSVVAQTQKNNDELAAGFNRGLGNVKNSIEGGINAITPGHPFNADLAQGLLNRNTTEGQFTGNIIYGLGKFAGETAATAPLLAVPGLYAVEGGGALANTARFIGGAGGEGNVFLRGASLASKGALQGGEMAALTSAGSNQNFGQQVAGGAITGGIAAPVFHGIGAGLSYTPKITEITRDLADKAVNKYGIDLSAPLIKNASGSVIKPTTVAEGKTASLRQQFTGAIMKDAQATPDEIAKGPFNPSAINSMADRTGESMNQFTKGKVVNGSGATDLSTILNNTKADMDKSEFSTTGGNALKKNIDTILDKLGKDGFTGDDYKALTASGTPFYKLQNSADSNVKFYASKVRNALDDAFEKTHNADEPDYQWGNLQDQLDLEKFRDDRMNYKKIMTIADAASEKTPDGQLDPGAFTRAVNNRFTNQSRLGPGSFGDLADIGNFFLSKNVAPTTKSFVLSHTGVGAAVAAGELGSWFAHNPYAAAGTIGAGLGIGALAKRAANSTSLRNRMISGIGNPSTDSYLANKFSVPATVLGLRTLQGQ